MIPGKICFIGYGNSIRRDDGLGPHILSMLEERLSGYGNFSFITLHQVDLALAPSLAGHDIIFFIDAAVDIENEVVIEKFIPVTPATAFSTHTGTLPQLLYVMRTLYNASPVCYVVKVRGYEFGFGEELSEKGTKAAGCAVDAIIACIGLNQ